MDPRPARPAPYVLVVGALLLAAGVLVLLSGTTTAQPNPGVTKPVDDKFPTTPPTTAASNLNLPEGLRHVPADAVAFVHASVDAIRASEFGKELERTILAAFGQDEAKVRPAFEDFVDFKLDDLASATVIVLGPAKREDRLPDPFPYRSRMTMPAPPPPTKAFRDDIKRPDATRPPFDPDRPPPLDPTRPPSFDPKPPSVFPPKPGQPDYRYRDIHMHDHDPRFSSERERALRELDEADEMRDLLRSPIFLLTSKTPIDRMKLVKRHLLPDRDRDRFGPQFHIISDRTLAFGEPSALRQYVWRLTRPGLHAGALRPALETAGGKAHIAAGFRMNEALRFGAAEMFLREGTELVPFLAINHAVATLEFGTTTTLTVRLAFDTPNAAEQGGQSAKTMLAYAQLGLEESLRHMERGKPPAQIIKLLRDAQAALGKAEVRVEGNNVHGLVRITLEKDAIASALAAMRQQVEFSGAKSRAANNLSQIGLAMHNFHNDYGHFPTTGLVGNSGQPGKNLSWRVALLPYLDHKPLYDQFRHNEPWDSPHNIKLLGQMPKIYASQMRTNTKPGYTYYQGFVGHSTFFDSKSPVTVAIRHFPDGLSNTLMLVEAGTAVPWTKPEDIPYDREKPILPKLGGDFEDGFHVLMADRSVKFIRRGFDERAFCSIITRDDNIPTDWKLLEGGGPRRPPIEDKGEGVFPPKATAPVKETRPIK